MVPESGLGGGEEPNSVHLLHMLSGPAGVQTSAHGRRPIELFK